MLVIGFVESVSLEDDSPASGQQAVHLALALRTDLFGIFEDGLELLELVSALAAFVFVCGHCRLLFIGRAHSTTPTADCNPFFCRDALGPGELAGGMGEPNLASTLATVLMGRGQAPGQKATRLHGPAQIESHNPARTAGTMHSSGFESTQDPFLEKGILQFPCQSQGVAVGILGGIAHVPEKLFHVRRIACAVVGSIGKLLASNTDILAPSMSILTKIHLSRSPAERFPNGQKCSYPGLRRSWQ